MKRYLACAVMLGLLALVVGGLLEADRSQEPAPAADSFSLIPEARAQQAGWGDIKGRVVFGGDKIPERQAVQVNADQGHCLAKGKILDEEWVVNPKNKGVQDTFVWLDVAPKTKVKLPIHPELKAIKNKQVVIDQPMCAFIPHALAMREGQELVVKNSSPVAHNVNCAGHPLYNPAINVIVPSKGQYILKSLKADKLPLRVACNIHGWMKARVAVLPHPYFAVTDADGNFEIKNAPAGEYYLKVYHDAIGWRGGAAGRNGEKITIKKDGTVDLGNLEVKPAG